jgi:carbon monoxide dehydrogenase subunit G
MIIRRYVKINTGAYGMLRISRLQQKLCCIITTLLAFTINIYPQENWDLAKEENGIKVYTKTESGSAYKSFKAEMQVNCNIDEVVKTLKNANDFKQCITNSKEVKLLTMEGNDQYYYIETAVPWPFVNRDMIYHLHYLESNNKQIKVIVTGMPLYIQPKVGIIRIEKANGYWLLDSIGPDRTSVTYQMHVEAGGSVPAWLANLSIVNIPFSTFLALRNIVEK